MADYLFPYQNPRQASDRDPTEWEDALAAAIEDAFSKGHHDLDGLIVALNASRIRPHNGQSWTAESFRQTVRELGA